MKPFEFVLIIISVVVGLALTEFAIGVAFMIQHYQTAHFYWPHFVMAMFGCVSLLNYWATLYKLRKIPSWSVAQIGLVFLSALVFFIVTKIYFPDPDRFDLDYEAYFNANVKIIFILVICFLIVWALEAFAIRKVRQIKKYAIMFVFMLMSLSGVLIDNHLYIGILGSVMLVMQLVYMYNVRTLIEER